MALSHHDTTHGNKRSCSCVGMSQQKRISNVSKLGGIDKIAESKLLQVGRQNVHSECLD